jgi:hypothetical protein
MSTALARRLDRVEDEHFAAAITHFADYCYWVFGTPTAVGTATAALAADPEEPEDTPFTLALWPVIELTTSHPTEQQAIRAALATVAPFVGLSPSAGPLPILAALEAMVERWERPCRTPSR